MKIVHLNTLSWQTGEPHWAELGTLNSQYEGFQRKTPRVTPMAVLYPKEMN